MKIQEGSFFIKLGNKQSNEDMLDSYLENRDGFVTGHPTLEKARSVGLRYVERGDTSYFEILDHNLYLALVYDANKSEKERNEIVSKKNQEINKQKLKLKINKIK